MTATHEIWRQTTGESGLAWVTTPKTSASFGALVLHDLPADNAADPGPLTGADPLPADVVAWSEALVACGGLVVAPWTGPNWWTDGGVFAKPDSASDVRQAIDGVVAWLAEQHGLKPPAIAIVGSGVGGHGALRMAYQTPQRFSAAAALRPTIDWHKVLEGAQARSPAASVLRALYEEPERARQDSATLHIHPLNWPRWQRFACPPGDPNHEGSDRLAMKLSSLGVPHEAELTRPEARDYDTEQIAQMARWIAERIGA